MFSEDRKKAKIGKVSIDIAGDRYRLRFTYPKGQRNQFKIIGELSEDTWAEALKIASLINRDIALNDVDPTYCRYSAYRAQSIQIAEKPSKQPNLVDLWETYKQLSQNRVAATTIKRSWIPYEKNYLGKTPRELLEIDKASEFIAHLLTRYSPGSLDSIFSNCLMPSVNLAVRTGKIDRNPYVAIPIAKKSKRQIEAYESEEIKSIVEAFYSDRYVKKSSRYLHSYYAPMIDFLLLVGCRPSECHALTWNDIKFKNGKQYIRFNKAYSVGILLPHTKTHEIRLFPINNQLNSLIETIPKIENENNLIFPSITGTYVNQKTFNRRYWKTVIHGLMNDGKLEKAYRCYSLRASFITRLVRKGVDIATVARLSGNSTDMICKHYLAGKEQFDVPEF